MSIRWDSVLVRHLAEELHDRLTGARLRALRLDGVARDLVLLFRDRTLLWRLHPDRGYLRLSDPLDPDEHDLRVRARLRGVSAPFDDRIVRFSFLPERTGRPLDLVVELVGNRWNAIVVEAPDGVIRHVLTRRAGSRPLLVGGLYAPPPPTDRSGDVKLDDWLSTLGPIAPEERARALVRSFAWTSPLNADAILGAAGGSGGADDDDALRRAYARWRTIVEGDGAEPALLGGHGGDQPYPFTLPGVTARPVGSLVEALDACGADAEAEGDAPVALGLPPELLAALEATIRQAERRVSRLRAELRELEDPGSLRALGDLILARYHEVPTGQSEVTLTDFEGAPARVELDPTFTPSENADRYYLRAGKSDRAAERLPTLIEDADRALERLRALHERAASGEADAREVKASLPQRPPKGSRPHAMPSLPYRTFRSSGGLEIRVGRGSRHNDDLTFRHSAPGDVWLHARHTAGAHVVLRWPGEGAPPARDLEEAATLAALHSKARTSGSVPVDWTFRRYVRKPRGAPPGSVVPDRVKTVFVEPDPELVDELAERE